MNALSKLPAEVASYYEGGKRAMIGGAPCRMAAWYRSPVEGKDAIKALVAANEPIEPGELLGAPSFRFVPNPDKETVSLKPSPRGSVATATASNIRSKWWKPARLSLDPMYNTDMAGDDAKLTAARKAWAEGDPQPLRDYLAATAGERREAWAKIDRQRLEGKPASCHPVSMKVSAPMTPVEFQTVREMLELSREDMALWLDVSLRTVFRYESGAAHIPKITGQALRLRAAIASGDVTKALEQWAS